MRLLGLLDENIGAMQMSHVAAKLKLDKTPYGNVVKRTRKRLVNKIHVANVC